MLEPRCQIRALLLVISLHLVGCAHTESRYSGRAWEPVDEAELISLNRLVQREAEWNGIPLPVNALTSLILRSLEELPPLDSTGTGSERSSFLTRYAVLALPSKEQVGTIIETGWLPSGIRATGLFRQNKLETQVRVTVTIKPHLAGDLGSSSFKLHVAARERRLGTTLWTTAPDVVADAPFQIARARMIQVVRANWFRGAVNVEDIPDPSPIRPKESK